MLVRMHDHAHHGHTHAPLNPSRAFAWGIGLNLAFVAVEWAFGVFSHSLALIADAGHNLGDVLGLALAWSAFLLARRKPCGRFTYGLGRSSILAALFNALLLMAAVGAITWEALRRLQAPPVVEARTMIWVALVGIAINAGTALLFLEGRKHDLNQRGAFLHMALDALVSVGVVLAGLVVMSTGWHWIDPALSLVISVIILGSTWGLLKEALRLVLDGVPPGIDLEKVRSFLLSYPGVCECHDLHVWATSTTENALSAHLRVEPQAPDKLLAELAHELDHDFGITHTTIQLEHGDPAFPCTTGH